MDVLVCASLTAMGSVLTQGIDTDISLFTTHNLVNAFFVQYLIVRFYWVFLYPRYFSLWRHLATPEVGRRIFFLAGAMRTPNFNYKRTTSC
jgi:hypothetical protein